MDNTPVDVQKACDAYADMAAGKMWICRPAD